MSHRVSWPITSFFFAHFFFFASTEVNSHSFLVPYVQFFFRSFAKHYNRFIRHPSSRLCSIYWPNVSTEYEHQKADENPYDEHQKGTPKMKGKREWEHVRTSIRYTFLRIIAIRFCWCALFSAYGIHFGNRFFALSFSLYRSFVRSFAAIVVAGTGGCNKRHSNTHSNENAKPKCVLICAAERKREREGRHNTNSK